MSKEINRDGFQVDAAVASNGVARLPVRDSRELRTTEGFYKKRQAVINSSRNNRSRRSK